MLLPTLDPVELRVLGALVEKSLATPDAYPLTLNSLRAACNQKSSRDPVMELSERDVSGAIERLGRRKLVGTASGAGHRTVKYRHALEQALSLSRHELATLALLLLRGPQTPGEVRSRVGRMAEMSGVDEADEALWLLGDRVEPLVANLGRGPGQSADRFAHTLGAETPEASGEVVASPILAPGALPLATRVAALEADVAALRDELTALRQRLGDLDEASGEEADSSEA